MDLAERMHTPRWAAFTDLESYANMRSGNMSGTMWDIAWAVRMERQRSWVVGMERQRSWAVLARKILPMPSLYGLEQVGFGDRALPQKWDPEEWRDGKAHNRPLVRVKTVL